MSHCDDDNLVVCQAKNDSKRKSSQCAFAMECVYGVKLTWVFMNAMQ